MTITVRPMPEQVSPDVQARLARCETATVGHFENESFMSSDIRAVIPAARVAGTAVTLRLPNIDATLLSYCLSFVRPGDFLVIDRCGDRKHACWGAVVSVAAQVAGVVGFAVDGPTTDFSEQRAIGLPGWCTGPAPLTARRLGDGGAINVPVGCGGVVVNPGDAILADESGVFVCPAARAGATADEALRRQVREPELIARLRAGEKFADVLGTRRIVEEKLKAQGDQPLG
ncbi:MAG: hypothetical protein WD270_09325 [Acetobacterales bacterium]